MDINKEAQEKATQDHSSGLAHADTSSWDYGARTVYNSQRDWLKQQEDAKSGR